MRTLLLAMALILGTVSHAHADKAPVYTSWKNNLAIGGYDTVSFFSGKPIEGKEELSFEYNGAEWLFSTRGNLELFKTNPEAFAPQYGGYCAWAIAKGKLAKGAPQHWHVEDGNLYLNFNGRIKRRWLKNVQGFIDSGNERWPEVLKD